MQTNKTYVEPCLETLKKMPDEFIDCVITSPPYWQLRDYGYEGQWGLEPTFEEYLENLWKMMDEIYRVLKPEGTCWINLGDTYNSISGGIRGLDRAEKNNTSKPISKKTIKGQGFEQKKATDVANKCLLLIPHRFAIGCIDRGWIIRNDIVWAKRNGMPESCTDRFSKKHEYFFFMVKSEKYYFDLDAIRDKNITFENRPHGVVRNRLFEYDSKANNPILNPKSIKNIKGSMNEKGVSRTTVGLNMKSTEEKINILDKNPGSVADFWDGENKSNSKYKTLENEIEHRQGMHQQRGMGLIEKRPLLPSQKEFVDYIKSQTSINLISQNVDIPRTTIEHWFRKDEKGFSFPSVEDWTKIMEHLDCNHQDFEKMNFKLTYVVVETDDINKNNEKGKNPGSVSDFWDIPTKPSKNEHYASYNDELIRKPILAGCPENGIVYDPFMGTGSTAEVCLRAKRRFIGSEMNASYVDITNKRLEPFLKQNQLF